MSSIREVDPESAEYVKDYNKGWRVGESGTEGAPDRADAMNVSHAWYDGYMDAAAGRDKWTWRAARRGGFGSIEDMYRAQAQGEIRERLADPRDYRNELIDSHVDFSSKVWNDLENELERLLGR